MQNVSHLLDDFFFVGKPGTKQCQVSLDAFLSNLFRHKCTNQKGKTHLPSTVIVIYGIEIDSDKMIARHPCR